MDDAATAEGARPDDETLDRMLRGVPLSPLLAALAQATGDRSILDPRLSPDPALLMEPQGGLTGAQRAAGRKVAIDAIKRLGTAAPLTDHDDLAALTTFTLGQPVSAGYLPLLLEELGVAEDLRAPEWRKDDIAAERPFRVVVIGAGMSGLAAAHRLQQAGVAFVILEKNADVGGTWYENSYPGCRVDVPNHLYSYSFAQRRDWPLRFTPQGMLLDYFRSCADELDLRRHLRCNTEVLTAEFDEARCRWALTVRGPGGTEVIDADVVVSAVGQLNRPSVPAIDGLDSFAGPRFHSAEWAHHVPLAGKRVAVIGTGASGFQLIPRVADEAAEVLVFQRTPNWFMPTPDYFEPMPDGMQWLLTHVPFFSQWYRFWLFWRLAEGALEAARVDPSWDGPGAVSELNNMVRTMLSAYLESEFADTPELLEHVIPDYPPFAKRMLLDNGTWARTLKRDDVQLITTGITRVTPTGVVTDDGVEHAVDVIVLATGFQASQFLTPIEVIGRDGRSLHAQWGDEARAYIGVTVPGFPNLFCLYGPNTNLVANGSIIFFSECGVRYIVESVRLLLERGVGAMDCRAEVCADYNTRVDEANRAMAWGASTVNSWYKNSRGRVTQNWPFTLLEFWEMTRQPNPDDYELLIPAG